MSALARILIRSAPDVEFLAVSFPLFYLVGIFLVPKFCNHAYLRRWRRHQEKNYRFVKVEFIFDSR